MRFLANENFPLDAVVALRLSGHDVLWIRTDAPGSRDEEILARAVDEERILLTFDKDFGELAFRSRLPASCGIILFRVAGPSSNISLRLSFRSCKRIQNGPDTSLWSRKTEFVSVRYLNSKRTIGTDGG